MVWIDLNTIFGVHARYIKMALFNKLVEEKMQDTEQLIRYEIFF